jgi:hypothetical protein
MTQLNRQFIDRDITSGKFVAYTFGEAGSQPTQINSIEMAHQSNEALGNSPSHVVAAAQCAREGGSWDNFQRNLAYHETLPVGYLKLDSAVQELHIGSTLPWPSKMTPAEVESSNEANEMSENKLRAMQCCTMTGKWDRFVPLTQELDHNELKAVQNAIAQNSAPQQEYNMLAAF